MTQLYDRTTNVRYLVLYSCGRLRGRSNGCFVNVSIEIENGWFEVKIINSNLHRITIFRISFLLTQIAMQLQK